MDDERFDALIASIYEAALLPERWDAAFAAMKDTLGFDTWSFMLHGPNVSAVSSGGELIDEDSNHRYETYFGAIDPGVQHVMRSSPGKLIANHHVFDERFVSQNEYYQDFLRPLGLRYLIGGKLTAGEHGAHVLGLLRSPERGVFAADELSFLERLVSHMQRSLRISHQLAVQRSQINGLATALEASPMAVFGLDSDGQIKMANRRAESMLTAGELLRSKNQRLIAVESSKQSTFASAIRACLESGRPVFLLMNSKNEKGRRYSVSIVRWQAQAQLAVAPAFYGVLCLISPVDQRRVATVRQLMELFRLSPAEARLARAIAAGMTIDEYARENDLKITTVKTQLRHVLEKTGTDRQASLVRLIGGVPAVRE